MLKLNFFSLPILFINFFPKQNCRPIHAKFYPDREFYFIDLNLTSNTFYPVFNYTVTQREGLITINQFRKEIKFSGAKYMAWRKHSTPLLFFYEWVIYQKKKFYNTVTTEAIRKRKKSINVNNVYKENPFRISLFFLLTPACKIRKMIVWFLSIWI